MYRILCFLVLFFLVFPIIWKLVTRWFMKIESKMCSSELNAEELDERKKALMEDLGNKKKAAEDQASEAERAMKKLER